ncbi:MAG: hypothetical protein AAGL29_13900, partial [Bacteroidota bacterium]
MKRIGLFFVLITFIFSCGSDSGSITIVPTDDNTAQEDPQDDNPDDGNEGPASEFDDGMMRGLSSVEIVSEMKTGWNLGNSLDVEGPDETFWGNPRPATSSIMLRVVTG